MRVSDRRTDIGAPVGGRRLESLGRTLDSGRSRTGLRNEGKDESGKRERGKGRHGEAREGQGESEDGD